MASRLTVFYFLSILVKISSSFQCSESFCHINCTVIESTNNNNLGCSSLDILNASNANSLTVDCESDNPYSGGCQLITILCPINGHCTINCNDYYGCYHTNITSSNGNLTLNCNSDHSCIDTILNVENIAALNINCNKLSCHNMKINGNNIANDININCVSDYSCSNNIFSFNNSLSAISINAMGLFSFYNNIIFAPKASLFHLFCGSEAYAKYFNNEFGGCVNSTLYVPPHPHTIIDCEGEGCYGPLNIYAINGGLDLNISLNSCNECDDLSCINQWDLHCNADYQTHSIFMGDSCSNDHCDCGHSINTILNSYVNNDIKCQIFSTDYTCEPGMDCNVNCNNISCQNMIINGAQATSLHVTCDGDALSCANARISCPTSADNACDILCNGKNACFETEIHATRYHTKYLNVTCIGADSCSYTEINALYTSDITMQCIVSEACDNLNIYANFSDVLTLVCEARDIDTVNNVYSSAYAACNKFNIFASFNTQLIDVQCKGDFSCFYPHIYAQHANYLTVHSTGQYGLYYGNIYAQKINNNFALFCSSQFGEHGCYKTNLYAAQYDDLSVENKKKLNIYCRGHGCFYLDIYAINGWSDVNISSFDACHECNSIDECVQNWYMYCGEEYVNNAIFDGLECHFIGSQCDCPYMIQDIHSKFTNSPTKQCDFFQANIECSIGTECIIDCDEYADGCNGKIISGAAANSLVVNCNNDNGCMDAQIYCPTDKNSRCDIKCIDPHSCQYTQIYGDAYNLINIDCLATESCTNCSISSPDAKEINLLCFAEKSCQHMAIDAKFAHVVNMICSSNNTCDAINIIATNVTNEFNIQCNGYMACTNMYIYAESANTVNINAIGTRALHSGSIHAEYASNVNLLSYADDYIWCVDALLCSFDLYLPPAAPNDIPSVITCQGYGCYNLNIYSLNGLADYTFKLNGCGICSQQYFCYAMWYISCGTNYDSRVTVSPGSYCYDNVCGCTQSLQDTLQISWDEYNSLTCESHDVYNFSCMYDSNGYCVIECAQPNYFSAGGDNACTNKIINATDLTSSIIVNCGDTQSAVYAESAELGLCENAKIYCPVQGDTECVVNCVQDDSCTNLKIYSRGTGGVNTVWLNCSDYGSCEFTKVVAPHLKQIDVLCDNTDACYGLAVEATYTETVNIVCTSSEQTYDYRNYYWDYYDYNDYYGMPDDGGRGRRRRLKSGRRRRTQVNTNSSYFWDYYDYYYPDYDYDWPDYYDWDYTSNFACDQIVIDANYSTYFNIYCQGNSSCYYSLFYGDYADHINLTAIGQDSMYYGYLYATEANQVDVKCWSAYDYDKTEDSLQYDYYYDYYDYYDWFEQGACVYAYFYIPTHGQNEEPKANFLCQGYGCYDLNIYSIQGLRDMNILVDGCKVCSSIDECIGKWSMNCGDGQYSNYDYYDGKSCLYGYCDCNTDQITFQDTMSCAYNWNASNDTKGGNMHHHRMAIAKFSVFFVIIVGICICIICMYVYRKRKENIINKELNGIGENNNYNQQERMAIDSENLARALAQSAMEGHGTTKNQSGVTVSAAQFIAPSGHGFEDKANGDEDDKAGLINN